MLGEYLTRHEATRTINAGEMPVIHAFHKGGPLVCQALDTEQ